ncbi:hypothetical protein STAN_2433 [Streptomyces sp. CBMAI 2042]|nr:hypothetical protein STAN_2433 [Streptomyces sp. CBMAI 2042]
MASLFIRRERTTVCGALVQPEEGAIA